MIDEQQEWLAEMVDSWVEVYKKSMTTYVVLELIDELPTPDATTIAEKFTAHTTWDIAERALYRTLRRLTSQGFVTAAEHAVPRTGLRRKSYELTDAGESFLAGIRARRLS